MDRPPGDPALATAAATSAALALTLALVPWGPWLAPLGLLGGIWAPGYALVAIVYPRGRLSLLERHGLSAAAGLLLLPLAVLGLSLFGAYFTPAALGFLLLAFTLACALPAALRHRPGEEVTEPPARGALPGTRATLVLSGGALAVAALLLAPTFIGAAPEPPALALTADDGTPLPLQAPIDATVKARLLLHAGDAPVQGRLVATWDDALLADLPVNLPAGGVLEIPLDLPIERRGSHVIQAEWEGPGREVHATIQGVRE